MISHRCVVVGAGGIGSAILPLVLRARMGAGTGLADVLVVDGDAYERKNIQRQQFPLAFIGMNKALAQKEKTKAALGLVIRCEETYITEINIDRVLPSPSPGEGIVVFSGVDNHRCRWLLSQWAQRRMDKHRDECVLLVTGGNDKWDGNVHAYGRWMDVERQRMVGIGRPMEDRHPEINKANMENSREGLSCQEVLLLEGGEQTMAANYMAAALMFAIYQTAMHNPRALEGLEETYFDCLSFGVNTVRSGKENELTLGGVPAE